MDDPNQQNIQWDNIMTINIVTRNFFVLIRLARVSLPIEHIDVAIVGGGPAGSAAAHASASRGATTLVLERGFHEVTETASVPILLTLEVS